jgi:F0F1-type ATP synthase assembly protein I
VGDRRVASKSRNKLRKLVFVQDGLHLVQLAVFYIVLNVCSFLFDL